MQNKLNFSFKSSFFAFKNNSKIEIENQKIKADFPNIKFGILQDGNKDFEIEKENIFSMGFSFVSSIIFAIIGIIISFIWYIQLAKIYYQEEYGIYAMISFLLGFFGWIYMYDNIIKPKKKLEEMNLSVEFLVRWVFVVISVILFLFVFFKVWFTAIFIGLLLASGILLILSALSLQFQIVDKKWMAYNFPILFWQFGEVNRIFRANFPEFFKEKVVKNLEEKNIENQENIEIEENYEENKKVYVSSRKSKNSDKVLLIGLLVGALFTTIIAYFLPLENNSYSITFAKMIETAMDRSGETMGVFALILPFILMIILGIITFFIRIFGGIKIFTNILSGLNILVLFGLAFFPLYYINLFIGKMSAREIERASGEIVFGLWSIMLIIAMICMIIYTFKINFKK